VCVCVYVVITILTHILKSVVMFHVMCDVVICKNL